MTFLKNLNFHAKNNVSSIRVVYIFKYVFASKLTEIVKVDFWRENSNICLTKIEKIVVVARKCCKMRLLWQSKLYFQIMGQEDVKVRRCSNKLSSSKATFISSLRRETEAIIARCYTTPCSTKAPEENKNREENAYWKKNMVVWQCLKII